MNVDSFCKDALRVLLKTTTKSHLPSNTHISIVYTGHNVFSQAISSQQRFYDI
jgi:hypothetical protein